MANLPDFEAWAIFAKVAERGSFSAAASELNLSKATISKAVARLEERLGAPLLHRSSRRLSLSETGRASLERAQRILAEGEAAEEEASEKAAEPRGLVRLAAPMSFGVLHLGELLPDFLALYPKVSVEAHLSDQYVDLIGGGYDVALRIGALADSSLRARRLFTMRAPLVGSPAYFARHGRPHHPRELEHHQLIRYSHRANPGMLTFYHPLEGECTVRVDGRILTNNGDIVLPSLLGGIALGVQPEFFVWQHLRDGRLEEALPGWAGAPAALHIVTPPGTRRPARVRALIDFLAERFLEAPWAHGVPAQE